MKIACFTDTYLPKINGISFSVDVFCRLLSMGGNEIEIYAPAVENTAKFECRDGITVRRFFSVSIPTYKDVHITIPDIVKINNLVEKFNPDVIHIHSPATLGLTGLLMAKLHKKPVLGTYHTLLSEMLVYASFDRLLARYLKVIDNVISGAGLDLRNLATKVEKDLPDQETIPQKITWSLVNRVYGYCDVIICPSEAIKRELVNRGVKNQIEVLSNGVDLNLFPIKDYSHSTGRIIHVGRLGFEKNTDVVIRAFGRLAKDHPEWRLIIAGDGPAKSDLQGLTRELGLESKIEFPGMVPRDRLGEIYRSGDVFVTASTMETQGMVVLEAMASGLPVIGVDKFAIPDLVKDGINGFIVKPGSDRLMAEKIEEILMNPRSAKKLGKNSFEIAREHVLELMANKLFNLYTNTLVKEL